MDGLSTHTKVTSWGGPQEFPVDLVLVLGGFFCKHLFHTTLGGSVA